jgi:hypothetical protein
MLASNTIAPYSVTLGHRAQMRFAIVSDITEIETIAVNQSIREITRLRKQYGSGRWRKRKGIATVLLADGTPHTVELHWYEAIGVGPHEYKIKRFLE